MPNQYQRPRIPYAAQPLINNARYSLITSMKKSISADDLDGDINYLIDSLNNLYEVVQDINAGILDGANDPENIGKFPVTDGANVISWTKITEDYFSAECIPTEALQPGCVDTDQLADGSVTNDKIGEGEVDNNSIENNNLSFNKITVQDNKHFQEFFNAQTNNTLDGKKIQDNSLPSSSIKDNSLPADKIVNGSITNTQLSPLVRMPVGAMIPWTAPGNIAAPPGWIRGSGQLLDPKVYAELFAIYGTFYGGNGTTTFGIPDTRGRAIFGVDPTSGQPTGGRITNTTLGSYGGSETHTLNINEVPAHTHGYNSYPFSDEVLQGGSNSRTRAETNAQTESAGGGQPHNNMPPYGLFPQIIYTGVYII
ncbi:MAG: Microcystin dependent protein [Burkholderiales bacterium]|jgi:microcystin-dependent protein|nr:Microcystin dependent protein [Burkholderiales bacterium]